MIKLKTRMALLRENGSREHWVYRLYDADDTLLYVGMTFQQQTRYLNHRGKSWGDRIARDKYESYPDRNTARRAEAEAIHFENPIHNRQRPYPYWLDDE